MKIIELIDVNVDSYISSLEHIFHEEFMFNDIY